MWIIFATGSFFAPLFLPRVGWLLFLLAAPVSMFAAVITAYQEAARFRAAAPPPAGEGPEV
ncbi:hypothetical protein [Streptosporangium brasiliense]|nr:hypothetical protein [Streptosporangium brasiliense]